VPRAPHLPAAALSAGATVALVDTDAKTVVLSQSVDRTRRSDEATVDTDEIAAQTAPRIWDSLEATRQLAAFTGLAAESEPGAKTQALAAGEARDAIAHAPARWQARDWLLVASAALLGLAVAAVILRSGG
jgi:hypothetical protein